MTLLSAAPLLPIRLRTEWPSCRTSAAHLRGLVVQHPDSVLALLHHQFLILYKVPPWYKNFCQKLCMVPFDLLYPTLKALTLSFWSSWVCNSPDWGRITLEHISLKVMVSNWLPLWFGCILKCDSCCRHFYLMIGWRISRKRSFYKRALNTSVWNRSSLFTLNTKKIQGISTHFHHIALHVFWAWNTFLKICKCLSKTINCSHLRVSFRSIYWSKQSKRNSTRLVNTLINCFSRKHTDRDDSTAMCLSPFVSFFTHFKALNIEFLEKLSV